MVRTAILVSGGGRNLQAVIDSRLFGEIPNCDIVAVISSDPEAYALTRARAAGIDACAVDRALFPNEASFCEAVLRKLVDLDVELAVLAGYTHPVSRAMAKRYKNRIINVHPALMPAFSDPDCFGRVPHERAIAAGVHISGATAYFVTDTPLRGPIILQQAVEVRQDDTPASLQQRVMEEAEWSILPRAVALYCAGALKVEDGRVFIAGK